MTIIVFVYKKGSAKKQEDKKTENKEFPPKPKWKPNLPINYEMVEKTFDYYFEGNDLVYVIFQNGTCVPIPKNLDNPIEVAKQVLADLFNSHPDFNTLKMDDGNWLVSMSGKAFVICFKDEIEKEWEYIENNHLNHLNGLATDEVVLNAKNKPYLLDKRGKIGLLGRARWFLDAEFKKEIKVVEIKRK